MTARTTLVIAAALLTVGLGACSRSSDEPAPAPDRAEPTETPEPIATAAPTPAPAPSPAAIPQTNLAAEVPPEVAPAPDEQMMDDASATGMTARAAREDAATPDAAPVEPVDRQ